MSKDWLGNQQSIFSTLGASSHSDGERAKHDYYATDPLAGELLLGLEDLDNNVWECACGEGHLSEVFVQAGYNVRSTDLIDRGYGEGVVDFLSCVDEFDGDIVTNPPYRYAMEFVRKGLELVPVGNKVIMFLKLQFLESIKRAELFRETPPKKVWVSVRRILCAKNGRFEDFEGMSSAAAYAWFVWEKGFSGSPEIGWFNE